MKMKMNKQNSIVRKILTIALMMVCAAVYGLAIIIIGLVGLSVYQRLTFIPPTNEPYIIMTIICGFVSIITFILQLYMDKDLVEALDEKLR